MPISANDHVLHVTSNLEPSTAFHRDVPGLRQTQRPPLKSMGAWMGSVALEIHLTANLRGHLRPESKIDICDIHCAARVEDFEGAMQHHKTVAYSADAADGDPKQLVRRLDGPAPYRQAYLPGQNNRVIEISTAARKPT
jgi:hypothetical protein